MELSSKYVGTLLQDHRALITWRETMNCVAATRPVLAHIDHYLGESDFLREILLTLIHYSEDIVLSRPVRPGDSRTIKGMVAAILPHTAGTQIIIRFDAGNHRGVIVFTEHIGGLLRGVRCSDVGRGGNILPRVATSETEKASLWQTVIPVDRLRSFVDDGCTNIVFPIHTSKQIACAAGLPDIILQGTATLAFPLRDIINTETQGDTGRLDTLTCRFSSMVSPGTEIVVRLVGRHPRKDHTELFFAALNDARNKAISRESICLKNQ